jgi:molybdopterin-guanine dinucleotide biosynthesis protein
MISTTVTIGGFSSEVGKTTLMCELLRAFPGWEAIKMTRGHYRSCGKDPHACCVSHLLGEQPLIRSGHKETYAPGKDTGRYWDAGASNVHWVIVTDQQVEQGIKLALERVRAPGVLIEGNSFLRFVDVDFTVMVAPAQGAKIKPSARRALQKSSALYLFESEPAETMARARFASWLEGSPERDTISALPIYTREDLPSLITRIQAIGAPVAA